MKTADIIFKTIGYLIIIGGLSLLIYYAVYPSELYKGTEYEYYTNSEQTDYENDNQTKVIKQGPKPVIKNAKRTVELQRTKKKVTNSGLVGKWKVSYKEEGSVVYNMKKEGNGFNAYTYELQDENGYGQKVPAEKTLLIKSFNGKKGKGIYKIEYEGKKYDVPCNINLLDNNTFNLSYDYYGYSDTEKWKRVE